jgi:pimeloyl-ACP methyl ester carboxylesterase
MDLIRAAVGDEKLNYFGVSYGTFLGTLYAERFPERVGHLVLDAAVNPSASQAEKEVTQLAGFEQAMRSFVAACLDGLAECPLTGSVDEGMAQIHDFIAARKADPLPTGYGRPLTLQMALMGTLVAMYENAAWDMLSMALSSAMVAGDGSFMLQLADMYFERNSITGEFTNNMFDAFFAISCMDGPVDARRSEMDATLAQMREVAPTLADFSPYGALGCAEWPFPAALESHQITAEGAAPIIVVGTTGDPATPYENAIILAEDLSSAVLVTFNGEGHGAVGRSNDCIAQVVADYFVSDTPPADGTTC